MLFLRAAILLAVVTAAAMLSTVPGLQRISLAAVVGASGLLGWLAIRSARAAAQQHLASAELRRLNETLETQVEVRTAELRDTNARLGSIIDSAVERRSRAARDLASRRRSGSSRRTMAKSRSRAHRPAGRRSRCSFPL